MFNSRHPGPRRVWKGGSELRYDTVLPGSAGSGESEGEFQMACFGTTLHHFRLLGGSKKGPKACFGATLRHFWPTSLILSNTQQLFATSRILKLPSLDIYICIPNNSARVFGLRGHISSFSSSPASLDITR